MAKRVRKGSNCEKILEYLKQDGYSLTDWECIDKLRIKNLPQRINELEQRGYMFDRQKVEEGGTVVTRYTYSKDNT